MEYGFLNRLTMKAIMVGIFSLFLGCASTPANQELFMGEGFQSSLPNAGTQVVVWGNHSGAVSRTLGWLQEHQLRAVDPSWIEKELSDPGFALRTRAEQKAQVLAAAKSVGAPLVLFAQVEDNQLGRRFDLLSFGHQRLKIIGVEIRGMNAENGDVVFGAKAWNSEPLVESEQIVQDLTTFALHKAWNEPDRALPPQQELVKKKLQQERMTVVSSTTDTAPLVPEELQTELIEQKPQQGRMTVVPSMTDTAPLVPEELQTELIEQKPQQGRMTVVTTTTDTAPLVSEELQSEGVEPLSLEDEPSLGLQVASGALSVLYAPFKIVYAGLGGLMGGLAYLVTAGNEHTAQSVWDASIHGTYWLTPNHLQGKEAIRFKGEPSTSEPLHQALLDEVGGGVVK